MYVYMFQMVIEILRNCILLDFPGDCYFIFSCRSHLTQGFHQEVAFVQGEGEGPFERFRSIVSSLQGGFAAGVCFQESPENFFAVATRINIGSFKKIDPEFEGLA